VDEVCRESKSKESAINLLLLSTGSIVTGKGERVKDKCVAAWNEADSSVADTEEGLHYPVAVGYYARLRFTVNLLPLLQNATGLRRVVTVLAGTKEGAVNPNDFQIRRETTLFSPGGRGHITSMTTLALEAIAQTAPTVSFVHDYPGAVKSNLGNDVEGLAFALFRLFFKAVFFVFGPLFATPVDEAGERHVFFSTSARFAARDERGATDVPLPKGVTVARGTDGKSGSGVYSINNDAESAPPKVEQLLGKLREDGTAKNVWWDVEREFVRITGAPSI
jgi:hypothetical protein